MLTLRGVSGCAQRHPPTVDSPTPLAAGIQPVEWWTLTHSLGDVEMEVSETNGRYIFTLSQTDRTRLDIVEAYGLPTLLALNVMLLVVIEPVDITYLRYGMRLLAQAAVDGFISLVPRTAAQRQQWTGFLEYMAVANGPKVTATRGEEDTT